MRILVLHYNYKFIDLHICALFKQFFLVWVFTILIVSWVADFLKGFRLQKPLIK